MDRQLNKIYSQSPRLGCVLALVVMVMMCVWPFVLIEGMQLALNKLHLHPALGFLVVLGILAGSFVNVPLHRIDRKVEQVVLGSGWRGWFGQDPGSRHAFFVSFDGEQMSIICDALKQRQYFNRVDNPKLPQCKTRRPAHVFLWILN